MEELTSVFSQDTTYAYTLMNKDTPLLSFDMEDISNETIRLSNLTVLKDSPYSDPETLAEFITIRKPPKNREYIDQVLNLMQIKNTSGYLNISYGLSLNDTLWFKPNDCKLTWADVNLYENPFNNTVAHLAFSGQGLAGMHMKTTSPELGTNGMLPKCWKRYDDGIYLLKGGTSGCSNTGNEPYAEYYAAQILKAMQMSDYVDYDLVVYDNKLASKCKLFTSQEVGYTALCNRYNPKSFYGIINIFDSLNLRDEFNDLMCFDTLIYNTDRHLNNYGLLVDNDTFEVLGMAPIFDNGLGLLPYYTMDKDIHDYAKKNDYQNSGLESQDILALCLTERQKAMFRHLIGFKFPRHPLYNWPEDRLERMEALLQERLQWILSFPIRGI